MSSLGRIYRVACYVVFLITVLHIGALAQDFGVGQQSFSLDKFQNSAVLRRGLTVDEVLGAGPPSFGKSGVIIGGSLSRRWGSGGGWSGGGGSGSGSYSGFPRSVPESFEDPLGEASPPLPAIPPLSEGTGGWPVNLPTPLTRSPSPFIQVDEVPVPSFRGPGIPLAITSPDGPKVNVNLSAERFRQTNEEKFSGVAALFFIYENTIKLAGTGFLVRPNLLASARHVLREFKENPSLPFNYPDKIWNENVFAVFNLTEEKYNRLKAGRTNINIQNDPDIVPIKQGSNVYVKDFVDLGFVEVPQTSGRFVEEFSTTTPPEGTELVIIGAPSPPTGDDEHYLSLFCKNYLAITDIALCRRVYPSMALSLRVSTGKLLPRDEVDNTKLPIKINTNMGNSGSPVFNATSGKVVGMVIHNQPGSHRILDSEYNVALSHTVIADRLPVRTFQMRNFPIELNRPLGINPY